MIKYELLINHWFMLINCRYDSLEALRVLSRFRKKTCLSLEKRRNLHVAKNHKLFCSVLALQMVLFSLGMPLFSPGLAGSLAGYWLAGWLAKNIRVAEYQQYDSCQPTMTIG